MQERYRLLQDKTRPLARGLQQYSEQQKVSHRSVAFEMATHRENLEICQGCTRYGSINGETKARMLRVSRPPAAQPQDRERADSEAGKGDSDKGG
ncbi:unnamed protein product [Sphagnum balticum]